MFLFSATVDARARSVLSWKFWVEVLGVRSELLSFISCDAIAISSLNILLPAVELCKFLFVVEFCFMDRKNKENPEMVMSDATLNNKKPFVSRSHGMKRRLSFVCGIFSSRMACMPFHSWSASAP